MKTNLSSHQRTARGAILLEVILALVLFAAAATIVGTALTSAVASVERQKLSLHAADLSISMISEIQLGLRSNTTAGPEAFEKPFEHWTWQLVATPTETEAGESSDLTRMEVIIRHDNPVVVHRLTQVLRLGRRLSSATAVNFLP